MLICPLGYMYRFDYGSKNGTSWQCSATLSKDNKRIKCPVRLRTGTVNGYEMIKSVKTHSHEPEQLMNQYPSTKRKNLEA